MGYKVEINTMLRLALNEPGAEQLSVNEIFTIKRDNARIYPVNIPLLLLLEDWTVFGYCLISSTVNTAEGIEIRFKLISKFSEEEQNIYTRHLQSALKESGYL